MKDLSQETIKKIKEEHIRPRAKWKFLAENSLIWISLVLLVIFGAISFSLAYYSLTQLDWDALGFTRQAQFRMFFGLIPHFWILLLVFLLVFAFILFRHTKNGYRSGGLLISLLLISLFLLIGSVAHHFQADKSINGFFSKKVPGYQLISNNKEQQWSQPNTGLLGGEIIQIQDNGFELRDFRGENWQVNYAQNTLVKPSVELRSKEKIKVIGKKIEDKKFQAREIRPWEGKGMVRGKTGDKKNGKQQAKLPRRAFENFCPLLP